MFEEAFDNDGASEFNHSVLDGGVEVGVSGASPVLKCAALPFSAISLDNANQPRW